MIRERTLTNDGKRDVKFRGELIAQVTSHTHDNSSRWTEIDIYKTEGGSHIVQVTGRTCWQGEVNKFVVHVCNTETSVIDALTQDGCISNLAKEALAEADIECVTEIA